MKTKLFILVIALQSLWVIGTVAVQEFTLRTGTGIMLETQPVDPRDLIRGDYIHLRYTINSVSMSSFQPALSTNPLPGATVFVQLEKNNEFFAVKSASLKAMKGDSEHPVLRGKIGNQWFAGRPAANASVNVVYGLEQFYVHEGTGNPRGRLTAEIAVRSSGSAVLKQVYVDGKPYAEAMRDKDN
ncbi:MAG TPA: GDYXXLXY domain-containing protein [Verrucomicrobiae bacterium]|jgi:uncharacterized membrane-anchored protein|nr:GDYXXLXY domain-containing protein [Verrucomicrobiae bacterium]